MVCLLCWQPICFYSVPRCRGIWVRRECQLLFFSLFTCNSHISSRGVVKKRVRQVVKGWASLLTQGTHFLWHGRVLFDVSLSRGNFWLRWLVLRFKIVGQNLTCDAFQSFFDFPLNISPPLPRNVVKSGSIILRIRLLSVQYNEVWRKRVVHIDVKGVQTSLRQSVSELCFRWHVGDDACQVLCQTSQNYTFRWLPLGRVRTESSRNRISGLDQADVFLTWPFLWHRYCNGFSIFLGAERHCLDLLFRIPCEIHSGSQNPLPAVCARAWSSRALDF